MPQIFQVLRCYKCFIFQIHQTKKSNRWLCKLCGEKQSIKRHYGIGTGKDCRMHVQKLNIMQADKYSPPNNISSASNSDDENLDLSQMKFDGKSKWSNYIDENEAIEKPVVFNNLETKVKKHKSSHLQNSSKKIHKFEDDKDTEGHKIVNSMLKNNIEVDDSSENAIKTNNGSGPSSNSFDEINPSSKWANFVELSKENCTQDSDKIKNEHHGFCLKYNMKEIKKEKDSSSRMNSSSKWEKFIDSKCNDTIQPSNLCQDSNKQKEYVKIAQSELSPNIITSAAEKTELKNPQNFNKYKSNLETFTWNVKCNQSLFSISDEQDLDSILDI